MAALPLRSYFTPLSRSVTSPLPLFCNTTKAKVSTLKPIFRNNVRLFHSTNNNMVVSTYFDIEYKDPAGKKHNWGRINFNLFNET
ncbi:hypothetical protein RUND412_001480, partial [Rhizina undulata]